MIRKLLTASATAALLVAAPAVAQQPMAVDEVVSMSRAITVAKDKSLAFRLNHDVGELVIAQPGIAEIVAQTDRSFYVRGVDFGATNILVYGTDRQLIEVIDVKVAPDAQALQADLAAALPGENIRVANLADGFLLSGAVSTSAAADRAQNIAARYAPEAISSSMQVTNPEQVVLEVRILEAGRAALRDLGVNMTFSHADGVAATGSGLLGFDPPTAFFNLDTLVGTTNIDVTIQALEENGIVRTLAQPNLTALAGEEASFLAGGEFPFPIPVDANEVAIEFKEFGVNLKFTPEVRENGRIRMRVEPEVSQLDERQTLRINGYEVPSLSVRRAATTVELDQGRSFAIAGLFQSESINTIREVPGLGNIPILGALFRSQRWRDQETELVIIVTPRLADLNAPLPNPLASHPSENLPPMPQPRNLPAPAAAQTQQTAAVPAPAPARAAPARPAPVVEPAPAETVRAPAIEVEIAPTETAAPVTPRDEPATPEVTVVAAIGEDIDISPREIFYTEFPRAEVIQTRFEIPAPKNNTAPVSDQIGDLLGRMAATDAPGLGV